MALSDLQQALVLVGKFFPTEHIAGWIDDFKSKNQNRDCISYNEFDLCVQGYLSPEPEKPFKLDLVQEKVFNQLPVISRESIDL